MGRLGYQKQLKFYVAFLRKFAYNLNRNILLLSTVTERVLSILITLAHIGRIIWINQVIERKANTATNNF